MLADLLDDVEPAVLERLPSVQHLALDRVLLRGAEGPATDERVAAAAFRSVVESMARQSPVLVAIDGLPFLDAASQAVVGYAARRFNGPVGVLVTAPTNVAEVPDVSWLQLAHPDAVDRLKLGPLSLGALHAVLATRLGRTLSRPVITRIHQISGGNPFYALELARTVDADRADGHLGFPPSLRELVEQHLKTVGSEAIRLLLATACAADPTVEELAQATSTSVEQVVALLESVEQQGIIVLDGNRVQFTHPLLSYGVYVHSGASQRRAMHRTLASLTGIPELRARHLALAAVSADEATLQALDSAAAAAAARGAPSAAAELIELAIGLGGDNPLRRLGVAEQHFRAGAFDRADQHLQQVIDTTPPGTLRALALMLRGAVYGYGDRFTLAVPMLEQGLAEVGDDSPGLRVQGLLLLALAVGLTGDMSSSVDYARRAVADAEKAGDATARSHALALWAHVSFMYGLGTDEDALRTALELENHDVPAPITLQPSAVAAVNQTWTGNLHDARAKMAAITQRCIDRGNEVDVVWAAQFSTTVELWLGNFDDAAQAADEMVQHAKQIGGALSLIDALTCQAAVAAHRGSEDEARLAANAAIDAAAGNGFGFKIAAATAPLVFLEVSLRNYEAAHMLLKPMLDVFDPIHGTEIVVGGFLPDAIETLVALGHLDDAEPLVAALETNGARLDRPWMLTTAARGRAMLLSAQGDLGAAAELAEQALAHHARLPMPFERARTQLLLGQLQRRRRRRQAAVETLTEALDGFDAVGAPLWAARARADLARVNAAASDGGGLTPAELRIAERAAVGLSNRDIAAELFVSPKTVEMNLSRVYRKLGVRSRSQLHAKLSGGDNAASRG